MTTWDLSRIRYTVRKLTGKFDTDQLPDTSDGSIPISAANPPGVDDYINDFYLFDMPEHMRLLQLKQFYIFNTVPNCGTYNVPPQYYEVIPPIYIDNYQFSWYQSPDTFYRIWPELNFIDRAIATTDGINSSFTFTLTQTTVQQGSVVIGLQPNLTGPPSPQLESFNDLDIPILLDQPQLIKFTNPGTLNGNLGGTGTIDYLTGIVTITYATIPPAGLNINAHYHPYVASRPRDIMFFGQQLFLRPIPNDVYSVKMLAYIRPTVAISSFTINTTPANNPTTKLNGFNGVETDVPLMTEWWQVITYGAAIKILVEEGDYEEAGKLKMVFEEQKMLSQRRTLKQLANQRIPTAYAENNTGGPSWPIFPYY